jgi:hypothetical protein
MTDHAQADASMTEVHRACSQCGTSLPASDPILVKFRRCYYCGQHDPCGRPFTHATAPALIATAIGVIALVWTRWLS